ncbi:hypothetical protein [Streptomyces sp. NBC_00322]|uniref:hypothetical protein n=1 Tax=Streptomyces sp. NBC_00322 TaxID=2975712 RepID=UPI002E27C66C|nr:hypothetical protein [Streptomyces sp. NBC_00322]
MLSKGFGKRPTVVSTDGPAYQRHRAPLNRGLSAGRIASLVPYAAERAGALVDGFAAGPDGRVELMEAYARKVVRPQAPRPADRSPPR